MLPSRYTVVIQFNGQELEPTTNTENSSLRLMSKEKRPQDWSFEEKLKLIITCGPYLTVERARLKA
ncbi:MAG: hypothetical protein ACI955_000403 [Zhongshania sp.]|jgi:hypothetical protein